MKICFFYKGNIKLVSVILLVFLQLHCGQRANKEGARNASMLKSDTLKKGYSDRAGTATGSDSLMATIGTNANVVTDTLKVDSQKDEELFEAFFAQFKKAVLRNDKQKIISMIYFPFQTSPLWFNEDAKYMTIDKGKGRMDSSEFYQYYKGIFSSDVKRLFPKLNNDDITSFNDGSNDDYYYTLQKIVDKGSAMFEVYAQFTFTNESLAGSYFGFVFGKVNGQYKALSFYSKWPVKD